MKQITQLLVLIFLIGCVTTGDPLVVNAERVRSAAFVIFDDFLKLEYDHRVYLSQWPQIRKSADYIGDHGPSLLTTATRYIKAYKKSRSPLDKAALEQSVGALAPLTALAHNAYAQSLSAIATNTAKTNP